jgi:hypothetical protein
MQVYITATQISFYNYPTNKMCCPNECNIENKNPESVFVI